MSFCAAKKPRWALLSFYFAMVCSEACRLSENVDQFSCPNAVFSKVWWPSWKHVKKTVDLPYSTELRIWFSGARHAVHSRILICLQAWKPQCLFNDGTVGIGPSMMYNDNTLGRFFRYNYTSLLWVKKVYFHRVEYSKAHANSALVIHAAASAIRFRQEKLASKVNSPLI